MTMHGMQLLPILFQLVADPKSRLRSDMPALSNPGRCKTPFANKRGRGHHTKHLHLHLLWGVVNRKKTHMLVITPKRVTSLRKTT